MNDQTALVIDVTGAIESLDQYKQVIAELSDKATHCIIAGDESREIAGDIAKDCRMVATEIESARKRIKEPVLALAKRIDAAAAEFVGNMDVATSDLRSRILAYDSAKLAEIERERKRIEMEAAKERAKIEKQLAKNPDSALAQAKLEMLEATAIVATDAVNNEAPKSVRKVWKFQITDESLVPRTYMEVSDARVKAAVASGLRDIPGVRVYQENQLSLR